MKNIFNFPSKIINKFPLVSFIFGLIALIALIAIGYAIPSKQDQSNPKAPVARQVSTLNLSIPQAFQTTGQTTLNSQATIISSTSGYITKINFKEGQKIQKGQSIVTIGADIYGNNPAIYQSQIAQLNLDFLNQTATISSEINRLQKDLAKLGDTVNDKSSQISKESKDRTQDLIDQTQNILNRINTQLTQAYSDPLLADQIPTLEQTRLTLSANLSQLRSAYSSLELQSPDNTPDQISNRSRDLSYQQISLKQQSETLSKDLSTINLKLSRLSQSLYTPSSPVTGIVQQVFVKPGQTVSPGSIIAIVAANTSDIKITSYIPSTLVNYIDTSKNVEVIFNNITYQSKILFVSQIPTFNQMHTITMVLPKTNITTNTSSTPIVNLPLTSQHIFIPIDAIYQTATTTFVYKISSSEQGLISQKQDIQTGTVLGSLIQVTQGLTTSDQLITSRFTTPNQLVTTN